MSEKKTIADAILEAQKAIGAATKGSDNPFYNSTYADLGEVIKTVKEACNNAGISIIQPLTIKADMDGKPYQVLCTHLIHGESGQELVSEALVPAETNIQKLGAAITYLRRYMLQSMLLVPAEDNDANELVKPPKITEAPVRRKPKTSF